MTTAEEYFNKGIELVNSGYVEDALECFTQNILRNNNNSETYRWRGFCNRYLGRFEDAVKDYSIAIELNPEDSYAYTDRANAYINLGKYNEALCDCNKALELTSNSYEAYMNKGQCYLMLENYREAINNLSNALKLVIQDISNPTAFTMYEGIEMLIIKVVTKIRDIADEQYNIAGKYLEKNDYDSAIEILTGSINKLLIFYNFNNEKWFNEVDEKSRGFNSRVATELAIHYDNRAGCYQEIEEYEKAVLDETEAIKVCPNDVEYYYMQRAEAYWRNEKWENAVLDLTMAIELCNKEEHCLNRTQDTLLRAYINRAYCYKNLEQYENAIKDCEYILGNKEFFEKYADKGYLAQASKVYETLKVEASNNNDKEGYFNKGYEFTKAGNWKESIEPLTNAIKLNHNKIDAYFCRGTSYQQLGQYEDAIKDFTTFINSYNKEDSVYWTAYLGRMDSYVAVNDYENAIKDCIHVLENEKTIEKYSNLVDFDRLRDVLQIFQNTHETLIKWQEHINRVILLLYPSDGDIDKLDLAEAEVEVFKAYYQDSERTMEFLRGMVNNDDYPSEIKILKEFFVILLEELEALEEVTSDMSIEEKNKCIKLELERKEEEKLDTSNIDYSQLHYNPTQGRKLDL